MKRQAPLLPYERYTVLAKALHWALAALILGLLCLGFYMGKMEFSSTKMTVIMLHKSFGMSVLGLVILRVIWRLVRPPPAPLDSHAPWEKILSKTVHLLLYLAMIGMPLSGWVMTSAAEYPVNFFGLFDIPMIAPKDEGLAGLAGELHEYFAFMLYAAIGLHFLGAAKHHIVDKDMTLRRMGGNTGIVVIGALFLLAITYFVVDALFFSAEKNESSEIASTQIAGQADNDAQDSDVWVINPESSYIRFTFQQYGQDVQGEFGEFKGRIVFDPGALQDAQADIMIDTASITTGSDSRDEQAKSGEWFGTEDYPLVVFKTESFTHIEANQYTARGNLTIRGQTMPIVLPFSLDFTEIEDGTQQAVMVSQIALMRLDFGVGQGEWEKEDAIANEVAIDIVVNASRASQNTP